MKSPFSRSWYETEFDGARSIALVANGPSLLDDQFGPLIDTFDVVWRVNKFEIDGYEIFSGRKTDVYGTNLLFDAREYARGARKVIVSRPLSRAFQFNSALGTMLINLNFIDDKDVAAVSAHDFAALYGLLGIPLGDKTGRNPTTGLTLLYCLTRHLSPKCVGLFGFDFYQSLAERKVAYYFDSKLYGGATPQDIDYYFNSVQERRTFTAIIEESGNIYIPGRQAKALGLPARIPTLEQIFGIRSSPGT